MRLAKTKRRHHNPSAPQTQETAKRPHNKGNRLVFIVVGVAIVVSIAQLAVSNYFATKGDDLSAILAKKEALQEENDHLNSQIATYTSLMTVTQRAEALGLVSAKNIVFLPEPEKSQPVAFNNGQVLR